MLSRFAVLAGFAAALLAPAPALGAPWRASDEREVERLARSLGPRTGLLVADARGRTLAAVRPDAPRTLASVTKLFTTSAALLATPQPPQTRVELLGTLLPDGTLQGEVVLRGGGDALLGEAGLVALRDAVVRSGVRAVTGGVVGDSSLFDAATGGPATGGAFDPEFGRAVGALTYDGGRQAPGGPVQPDPARAAAFRLDDLLEAAGVRPAGRPVQGTRPAGVVVGTARGSLPALVRAANRDSDAATAEVLAKLVAARTGTVPATSLAGAAAVGRAIAARLGIRPRLADGAGFVAGSRAAPRDVVRLLRRMDRRAAFRASLARPGRAGTLRRRLTSGPARTRCRAKTGTLRTARASGLAGVCRGRTFAILTQGPSTARAQAVQDRIAQRIARR